VRYPGTRINRPEDALQESQVAYLERLRAAGRLEYFAVPNEAKRSFGLAAKMKKRGLRAGVPDLCILTTTGLCGFIENKAPKGTETDPQKEWAGWLTENGHRYALVRSFEQFLHTLYTWGLLSAHEAGLVATIPHEGVVR
jgi:hypothetical protein